MAATIRRAVLAAVGLVIAFAAGVGAASRRCGGLPDDRGDHDHAT